MDPDSDPDPAIFVIALQDANKKLILTSFFCLLLFEGAFTSYFKDKKLKKKSQYSRNQGFSYYFCLMIGGSGSISLTNGSVSVSRRPKNIRLRIRIRIRNTGRDPGSMNRAGRFAGVPGARVLGGLAQLPLHPHLRLLPLPHRTLHPLRLHRQTCCQRHQL
jgi:hypothetical protein